MKKQIPISKRVEISTRISVASASPFALILLGCCCCWSPPAHADIVGLQRVASGLSTPLYVTHAPGDASRLFIVQRGGAIRILNLSSGVLEPTPFLTIPSVNTAGEGGLLGMAFHPDYQANGKFYVNVTLGSAFGDPFSTHVREYTVSGDPDVADAASARLILKFVQPQNNQNGGWIGFSPNNPYLYIATGDGGSNDDTGTGHTADTGNAQDITSNLLGKMLRVDVDGDAFPADTNLNYAIPPSNPFVGVTGDDEIFAYGLRNPFRASFDRATGDLWIGDVGQNAREEIDFLPASSAGGENYGWRLREGTIATPTVVGGDRPPGNVDPVYDYNRDANPFGGTVVTGGYVYRGPDPALQGKYFFLDSHFTASAADDNYWMFDPADPFGTVQNINNLLTPDAGSPMGPVSFGEDQMGNLYIAYIASGDVFRIQTTVAPIPLLDIQRDANTNVVLSWGTNFTGFTLETGTNLNTGVWSDASPAPAASGTNYVVTNTVSDSLRFYRLRQ